MNIHSVEQAKLIAQGQQEIAQAVADTLVRATSWLRRAVSQAFSKTPSRS